MIEADYEIAEEAPFCTKYYKDTKTGYVFPLI